MGREVSRRNFLKAAGLGALSVSAAGALSACTSAQNASSEQDASAVQASGSDDALSWLGNAPTIDESEITETQETEVLVVGCGTSGWPACLSAAEAGAKTLVIERGETPTKPREDIGALNSDLQRASFAEFPQFEIDEKDALEEIVRYANGYVSYDLVKVWAENSGELVNWLTDILNRDGRYRMEFEGGIGKEESGARDRAFATGHSPQSNIDDENVTFMSLLQAYADELGVEFRFKTELVKLEQNENGRVTGIIARDLGTDSHIRINASNGVILSTGGYALNREMMEAMQPEILQQKISVSMGSTDTGEGIKAAMWLGAQKDAIGTSMLFNRACCKPDEFAGIDTVGSWFWFGEQPFLKVNLNGERFCNESGPYDYLSHSAYLQPHHTYVDIWDSNFEAQTEAFDEVGCCRLYPFDNGALNNIPISVVIGMNEGLIEDGYIQQADTIEELAEKLNIPPDTTSATLETYNGYATAGSDPDYYKEPHRLLPLTTPPYYGVRTGAWHLTTLDGIRIDTDMHALDQGGNPIEGLYVVGDCSGGFFCVSYPNLLTGLACGRSMTFGRRAAQLAATQE